MIEQLMEAERKCCHLNVAASYQLDQFRKEFSEICTTEHCMDCPVIFQIEIFNDPKEKVYLDVVVKNLRNIRGLFH